MPRRPPRSPRFASLGNLFREARRASPQRRNNGARACDGAGLPWLSASKIPPLCIARKLVSGSPSGQPPAPKRRKRRGRLSQKLWPSPGKLFREARRASPQRQNIATARVCHGCRGSFGRRPESCFEHNGARACDGAGLSWLSASKIPPLCVARKLVSGSPSGHPPAPKRRKRARGRLSQKLWPSPGKLFREARGASPQRQNNGARACDGAGLPWLSRKLRPSPGKLFREARRASSQRHPERFLGKPDGPDPSVKTTGTSFRAARRARPKPKPSTILRVAKNGTRRARAGFLRTLNPKRF